MTRIKEDLNKEMIALIQSKSDNQSLNQIFKFLANKHGVTRTTIWNRYYHHIKPQLDVVSQLNEAQAQIAATAIADAPIAPVNIPQKGTINDTTPAPVKMALKLASSVEQVWEDNTRLQMENSELHEKLANSVSKDEHEAVKGQLRTMTQRAVEAEQLLESISIFKQREPLKVKLDAQGNVLSVEQ